MSVHTTKTTNPTQQTIRQRGQEEPIKLSEAAGDAVDSFRQYAEQRPEVVALWAFGIGFVLGWRLKPW